MTRGGFTLPGEAGYEALTLALCDKWGADCIRDSDGTQLSEEILASGIPVYSTLCLVRSVNAWAKRHPDTLQRNFLSTEPLPATGDTLTVDPLAGFFRGQFTLTPSDDPKEFWQVWDRTDGTMTEDWTWDGQTVTVRGAAPGHLYTVSFLATRIWEEISMYNHITNDWGDREHLMAVEPRYPEVRAELLRFLTEWCESHPHTSVVRFTSLFYNFAWFWGASEERRTLFADWGSYDFTVNPVSLRAFEKEFGYRMTAEDFVNGGLYRPTHNPPTQRQRDWMAFTGRFVRAFGKQCVDVAHRYGKKAYVFYDDSWIGLEPWSGHFAEFGFDGLIKCVFNAFEARLCAGVDVPVHELRLHPYLFPTGLTGEPTFAPGGHPEADARRYWLRVRRALLRVKVERIGLGGYLHLTEPFPAFQEEVARIADEFRAIRALHEAGAPLAGGVRVAVLQSWGSLRTWNCAGHMHEHPELPLNHLYEALAGLPFPVRALSLAEVAEGGVPGDVDVLINAGREGDAWSGGEGWQDGRLTAAVQRFVMRGGGLIGVGEPSAVRGGARFFALADVLGVDREIGRTNCAGKWQPVKEAHFITEGWKPEKPFHNHMPGVYAVSAETKALRLEDGDIAVSANVFGKGRAVYLNGFTADAQNARLLRRAVCWAASREAEAERWTTDDVRCECAYFPANGTLVVLNDADEPVETTVHTPDGPVPCAVDAGGMTTLRL